MSAAAIAATVVLCCFICGGAATILYYQIRTYLAWRRCRQWNSLASESDLGIRQKSYGNSLAFSTASSRESMMYHPEHRGSASVASTGENKFDENVTEQEPPDDYRVDQTHVLMSDIETSNEAERSPVSPLILPTVPRPVSNFSRRSDVQSLRREFSFEHARESPRIPVEELRPNRRSALSSNPPSDWPLAMPSYYGRGFSPQTHQGYQLAPTQRRSSGGWHSVVQRESFEVVRINDG